MSQATVLMQAPSTIGGQITGTPSGKTYGVPASGLLSVNSVDVQALLAMGFTMAQAQNQDAAGLTPQVLMLFNARNANGTPLAAAASAGEFGLNHVSGTETVLLGEAATGAIKTDTATLLTQVPNSYESGQPLTVTVNAQYNGTGVAGTKTMGLSGYVVGANGQHTAITVTPATNITSGAAANYTFTLSGAGLTPNAQLALLLTSTLQETGGTNALTMQVNGVTLS